MQKDNSIPSLRIQYFLLQINIYKFEKNKHVKINLKYNLLIMLDYTLNHKILKQIEHIDFPSLKQLSLSY